MFVREPSSIIDKTFVNHMRMLSTMHLFRILSFYQPTNQPNVPNIYRTKQEGMMYAALQRMKRLFPQRHNSCLSFCHARNIFLASSHHLQQISRSSMPNIFSISSKSFYGALNHHLRFFSDFYLFFYFFTIVVHAEHYFVFAGT